MTHKLLLPYRAVVVAGALLFFGGATLAAPVNSSRAGDVVKGWLMADPAPLAERLGRVAGIQSFKGSNGQILYYVVHLEPSGFVIVGGDDQIEPIVAFVARGDFNPSATNALGALVQKDLPGRLALAQAHPDAARFVKSHQKWERLASFSTSPLSSQPALAAEVSSVWVAPFLTTLWDQQTINDEGTTACYNYYTPPYGAGNADNYPCGCVATAMAQLMYYFQYPTAGVGTGTFSISVDGTNINASLRGGNGSGGAYVWTNMPAVPGNAIPSQCQAIGALTYDAGVAINMAYTADGSGATLTGACSALTGTFQYRNAVMGGQDNPDLSLSSGLSGMTNPNLDARQPVLYGIWAAGDEGHCVVCDGYGYSGTTLYHHLNLGWSGDDNAWYNLPDIDTADSLTFTNISSCIYNVYVSGSGEIISGRIVNNTGVPISGATVAAARTGGGTYSAVADTNGIYALVKLPSASTYTLTASQSGYTSASATNSTQTSESGALTSGNVWGANFTLGPAGPPTVVTSPQNQTALVGGQAVFSVVAAGTSPLNYRWQTNGVYLTDGGGISGSATSALTISDVGPANAAVYSVVLSNPYGTAASAGAVLSLAQMGASNLVQNGGFETDSFADWTTSGNVVDCFVSTSPLYAHAGSYGAELGPSGSLGYLSQNLPTTAGASYLLSLWLDSPNGLAPNEFQVWWNGTNLFDEVNMPETGWTNLQFVVTASGAGTPLELGFLNSPSYFGLDSIAVNSLTALPWISCAGLQLNASGATLRLAGAPGTSAVVVQASTDLIHWSPIYTNTAGSGTIEFTDPAAVTLPSRYYRAIIQN